MKRILLIIGLAYQAFAFAQTGDQPKCGDGYGNVHFKGATVTEMAQRFSECNGVRIEILDDSGHHYSAALYAYDIEAFIVAVTNKGRDGKVTRRTKEHITIRMRPAQ